MTKKTQITMVLHKTELNPEFTLEEFCEACRVSPDFIAEVMAFGVLESKSHFTSEHLKHVRKILQLQRDFEVNIAGAVLAIDLIKKIDEMHQQIEWLEKHWRNI